MAIKDWLLDVEKVRSEYSTKVDNLLSLYVQALHEYFHIESNTDNMSEFLNKVEKKIEKKSDILFFEWIRDVGLNQMKRILSLDLPFDSTVLAKIDFVTGTIKDELEWEDRDKKSTRSSVVNTLTNLTEQLIHLSNLALQEEKVYIESPQERVKMKVDLLYQSKSMKSRPLETVVLLMLKIRSEYKCQIAVF